MGHGLMENRNGLIVDCELTGSTGILGIAPQPATTPATGGSCHLTNTGSTSWHGFAAAIFEASSSLGGPRPRLEAIPTSGYPTPARRPANSRLDTSAFTHRFGIIPRPWQAATAETVTRIIKSEPQDH